MRAAPSAKIGHMRYLLLALALSGAIVSVLALRVHYSTGTEPCSINEHWDCGIVNHSRFALLDHVPVAAIGIVGYLVLAGLAFTPWRFINMLVTFGGFLFAFRLSMIEQYALEVWCLYCAISQTIIAVMLLLSIVWFAAGYLALKRAAARA